MHNLEQKLDSALYALRHRQFLPKAVKLAAKHKKGIRLTRPQETYEQQQIAKRPHEKAYIMRSYALRDKPDWVVERLKLTNQARAQIKLGRGLEYVQYPFWVDGHYSYDPRRKFFWNVPDVKDDRYDLTKAFIESAAKPFLGRTRSHGVK